MTKYLYSYDVVTVDTLPVGIVIGRGFTSRTEAQRLVDDSNAGPGGYTHRVKSHRRLNPEYREVRA